jgi:Histidine kinase-, DNA gyrase B-, and HSP90-like ATPase
MPAITLSPSFFKNELRAYTNWRMAFWRELCQNSVDAKASTIWIDFEDIVSTDAGTNTTAKDLRITFEDDGPGIDRPTLEETYFVVGETTKTGPDQNSIGGFGRARIITCFAHKDFRIHTQKWLCQGTGTQYTIEEAPEPYEGCAITVTISPELATMEAMEYALRSYLKTCQLQTNVYIRGTRFKEWTYKNRLVGQLGFGKIYLNKSKCSEGVLVRVNGVQMFTRCTAATWQIVFEIDPDQSRRILTSNRDGLAGDAANELDRFIGKIWVNPVSAARNHHQNTTTIFGSTVYEIYRAQKQQPAGAIDSSRSPNSEYTSPQTHNGNNFPEYNLFRTPTTTGNPDPYNKNITPTTSNGNAHPEPNPRFKNLLSPTLSYVHTVDCSAPELLRAAKLFLPNEISRIRSRLLHKWTDACAIAATELAQMEGTRFRFRTGFLFSEEDLGRCTLEGGIHALLVNPLNSEGLLSYKLSNRTDMAKLQAIAAHETLHMVESYHDERFAAKLTLLLGRILARAQRAAV